MESENGGGNEEMVLVRLIGGETVVTTTRVGATSVLVGGKLVRVRDSGTRTAMGKVVLEQI